jgi:TonB family protein
MPVHSVALGLLILGAIAAAPSPQSAPPARSDDQWPPPGVEIFRSGTGVTSPRLMREVKPNYTDAGMRARVEGIVTLQCVVLADGTVGAVRVVQSLDTTHGLDEAAVAALKQWRFAPATRDGLAVPVIVNVELAFTLRLSPPELTWPDGFASPTAADAGAWHDDTTEIAGLRIRVEYPDGWTLRKNGRDNEIVELRKAGSLSRVSIARPVTVPYLLDRPVPAAQLREIGDRVKRANAARGVKLEPTGLGQAPAAAHIWAWFAYQTSTLSTSDAPPAVAAAAQELFESARIWVFEATAGGQAVSVMCTAIVPRGTADARKAAALAAQSAEFGQIIRRMKIDVR